MKIKPCPFCGEVKFIGLDYFEHTWGNKRKYIGKVSCTLCGVGIFSSDFHDSAENAYHAAAQKWNRRADNGINKHNH